MEQDLPDLEDDSLPLPPSLFEWIGNATRQVQPEAVAYLEQLAAIETPSLDPQSQRPALELIAGTLGRIGMQTRVHRGRKSGGTLIARWPAPPGTPIQLLLGHCDTVWPHGTLSTMPLRRDGDLLYGPGVFDMKGGLTQLVFALRVVADSGRVPAVRPVVLINSDEEIGTLDSYRTIARLAAKADRALVLEPSLAPDGRLKTARKGVAQYRVTIHGRAAHAGLNPGEGISAIVELSYVVQQLHALNDVASGVTVNVGTIEGGMRPNVVAPKSTAYVDVRVPTQADSERIDAAIRGLRPTREGITYEIEATEGRPPMEFTAGGARLWEAAREIAGRLDFSLDHGRAGGGSDGNISGQFTPTLDGLGAVGDGAHSAHEHVNLEHIPARTALLAALLLMPPLAEGRPDSSDA